MIPSGSLSRLTEFKKKKKGTHHKCYFIWSGRGPIEKTNKSKFDIILMNIYTKFEHSSFKE